MTYTGLIPGHEYTLVGTLMEKVKTGDKFEGKDVMDKDNKPLTATATFTPEKADGTTTVSFIFSARSVAGKTLVVYEELFYDNMSIAAHADITDEEQTVTVDRIHYRSGPTMSTTATFANGAKSSGYASRLVIVDTVSYSGLTVGQTYTLVGKLMDAQTGVALRDTNDREVTSTLTFTPKTSDGSVDMKFSFNAGNIKGAKIVVFEEMYVGKDVAGTPYLSHTDINDAGQTVTVTVSPKTGDSGIGIYIAIGAIALGAVVVVVVVSTIKRKKNK